MRLIQIRDTINRTRPSLRLLAAAVLAMALGGCSAARLAYDRLDWLVRWELGRYVSLTAQQRAVFDREFGGFWQWHRQEELPLWVDELRGLAARLEPGTLVERRELESLSARYGEILRSLGERFAPIACAVGPQLDAEQVREVIAGVGEDIEELRRERVDVEPGEAQKDTRRAIDKGLRRWVGALSTDQTRIIDAWVTARPSVAGEWLEYRRRWQAELQTTLDRRAEPAFCDRITGLLANGASLWTQAQQEAFARNRSRWLDLFAALIPTLTPEQRRHAQERLRELADELAAAAAAGNAPTPASAIGGM